MPSFSGSRLLPAAVNYGVEAAASMVGTFAIRGGLVTFRQTAATFVRQMSFTLSGKTLSGTVDYRGSGTIVICVLTRP